MQLLSPGMLAILGLIPVLLLIHALKPKPKPLEVTNLFLWQEVLKERAGSRKIEKIRRNLPLFLQIALVALAALSLCRPVWSFLAVKKGDMILVIDCSASMKTRTGRGTRFDLAREEALSRIDRREKNQKVLIVCGGLGDGRKPELISGFLEDAREAKSLVRSLRPSDAPGRMEEAVALAFSFVNPSREDTVYLITDGAGYDLPGLLHMQPGIVPVLIGGGDCNVGITKFEFRKEERKDAYEIMLEVKNFTPVPMRCPVRLSVDRTVIHQTTAVLGPDEKKRFFIPYSGIVSGIAEAALEIEDDFTVDNKAYLSLSAAKDIWVLLVSRGNYFLEKLLQSYPNLMVNSVAEIVPSSWREQALRHDIVIIDRIDFPATERGNFLLIDSFSPSIPASRAGRIDFPEITDWDKKSPLMSGVDLAGLIIEEATRLEAEKTLHPVLEARGAGLMYTYEHARFRAVWLGFDITRSELPLKVSFPVMMSNIIQWLNPHKLQFSSLQASAGDSIEIYLDPQAERVSIRPPGGKWETHGVVSNPFQFTRTETAGVYTVSENGKESYFTVNLNSEAESDIRAASDIVIEPKAGANAEKTEARQHLWAFFLAACSVLLLAEWCIWLRVG